MATYQKISIAIHSSKCHLDPVTSVVFTGVGTALREGVTVA